MPHPSSRAREGQPALRAGDGRVTLTDVSFAYPGRAEVLEHLSLSVEPGKTTALVGGSGGGKSTILNLVLRFFDPSSGEIRIDGQNTREVDIASLRAAIGYVSQDVYLFRGSIRDNIALGKPGASDEEIVAAAKAAHAHAFISGFRLGYDTDVGELGTQLSGGQKQRIADRARLPEERADPSARRAHRLARSGIGTRGAKGARRTRARAHHARRRAPPADRGAGKPHLCDRERQGRRSRHA